MKWFSKKNDLKILEKINSKSSVKRHIQLVIGCLLIATSYNLFLVPNNIVAGGVAGFAIIINYLFNIDIRQKCNYINWNNSHFTKWNINDKIREWNLVLFS